MGYPCVSSVTVRMAWGVECDPSPRPFRLEHVEPAFKALRHKQIDAWDIRVLGPLPHRLKRAYMGSNIQPLSAKASLYGDPVTHFWGTMIRDQRSNYAEKNDTLSLKQYLLAQDAASDPKTVSQVFGEVYDRLPEDAQELLTLLCSCMHPGLVFWSTGLTVSQQAEARSHFWQRHFRQLRSTTDDGVEPHVHAVCHSVHSFPPLGLRVTPSLHAHTRLRMRSAHQAQRLMTSLEPYGTLPPHLVSLTTHSTTQHLTATPLTRDTLFFMFRSRRRSGGR